MVEAADQDGTDLMPVGTGQRAGMEHMVLGGVAERVLAGDRDVLVIPRTAIDEGVDADGAMFTAFQ